jgi:hypothetical protein
MSVIRADTDFFRKCLLALQKICGLRGILPSSHLLSDGLATTGHGPVAFGGFADIWEGTFGRNKVALKVLRINDPAGITKVCIV